LSILGLLTPLPTLSGGLGRRHGVSFNRAYQPWELQNATPVHAATVATLGVVETQAFLQNGVGARTHRGSVAVWVPCPNLLVVAVRGFGEADFTLPIVRAYEGLAKKSRLNVFMDCEHMTNYESALRTVLTHTFMPDRERFGAFLVLVSSRLVAMGVSVASMALGGIIESTGDRSAFKAALDASLYENHVVGFSSNALDTLLPQAASSGR
jgi:hypothetical protein